MIYGQENSNYIVESSWSIATETKAIVAILFACYMILFECLNMDFEYRIALRITLSTETVSWCPQFTIHFRHSLSTCSYLQFDCIYILIYGSLFRTHSKRGYYGLLQELLNLFKSHNIPQVQILSSFPEDITQILYKFCSVFLFKTLFEKNKY